MQLIDYLIEGAYQRYLEKRGSQPHSAACHEQAHGMDEHNHHAAVVGAIASMHTSKAHLGNVAKHPAEALKDPADTCQDPTHEHVHSHGHKHSHKHSHDEEAGLPDSTEEGGSEDASACAELGIAGRVRMGRLHVGRSARTVHFPRSTAHLIPPLPHPHPCPNAGTCQVHGEGCSTLIHHKHDVSRVFGIYLMEAGIIFHSGEHGRRRKLGRGLGRGGCRALGQRLGHVSSTLWAVQAVDVTKAGC